MADQGHYYEWEPGDELTAERLNKMNPATASRLLQAEHNILQLALEAYFDAKDPEYNGLVFDGFSDEDKADARAEALFANASSGQPNVKVESALADIAFEVGETVQIYNGSNQEVKVIEDMTEGIETSNIFTEDFNRANSGTVGNGWTETGSEGMSISSNTLQANLSGGLPNGAYRAGAANAGVVVKFKFRFNGAGSPPAATDRSDQTYVLIKSNTTTGGLGVKLHRSTGGGGGSTPPYYPNSLAIYDNGNEYSSTNTAFSMDTWYWVEFSVGADYAMEVRWWADGGSRPSSPNITKAAFTPSSAGTNWSMYYNADWNSLSINIDDLTVDENKVITTIEFASNLSNGYSAGDDVVRTSANIDTSGKVLEMQAGIGDLKKQIYFMEKVSFQQEMEAASIWITRNWTARFNPVVNPSGSTIRITGDKTDKFQVGDTIDIYTADNLTRERRTINAIDYNSTNAGQTTITTNSALTGTYTTSAYVERVDVAVKLSLVGSGDPEDLEAPTYVRSIVDFDGSLVEDEYSYAPAAPGVELVPYIELTRKDTALTPEASRFGITLQAVS